MTYRIIIMGTHPKCRICGKPMKSWNAFAQEHTHSMCLANEISEKLINVVKIELNIEMKDLTKKTREKVDGVINTLGKIGGSRQLSIVKTKLQESRHWLGKLLEAMNDTTPYRKGDGERTVETLPATADLAKKELEFRDLSDSVGCIDDIRGWIDELVVSVNDIHQKTFNFYHHEVPLLTQTYALRRVYEKLAEAKMWAGEELRAIRELKG